jgi:integrase/recombinase XerD
MNTEAIQEWVADLALRGYSTHTQKAYKSTVSRALKFCQKNYKQIKTADLKMWLLEQQKKGSNLKTIRRHVNALRSFFEYYEMFTAKRIRLPRAPRNLPTFLNRGEIEKLLKSIVNKRDLAIVRLLYASGLRVSELVKLTEDDIEGSSIRVRSGKGRKDRVTYVDDGTLELIKEYLDERKDGNRALNIIKKHAKRAGIKKKVTPHTLRHTFATHLLENNANIVVIQQLLGHASLSTTQIYTHVTDGYKKETYKKAHPLSNGL